MAPEEIRASDDRTENAPPSQPQPERADPADGEAVIEVADLVVEYGRRSRRQRAVDGLSFTVRRGECVGFIGPNGAGKTSTIKALMGFHFPASGEARLFGRRAGDTASRRRLGYLPEVSLYYPFMKARELLELYGGLGGMSRSQLRGAIPPLLARVGLEGLGETLLRQFSKGMQQRLGIAQSLIADPDLLIFDELSSGLDPVGRYDLREVLLELKRRGKTIFFSSHELSEVETLCDRVVLIDRGRKIAERNVADLMTPLSRYEVVFETPGGADPSDWFEAVEFEARDGRHRLVVEGADAFARTLTGLVERGARVVATRTLNVSLENYFIGLIRPEARTGAPAPSGGRDE